MVGFSESQLRKKPVRPAGTSIATAAKIIVCSSRVRIGSNHSVNEESCGDSHPMAVKPNEYPIMFRKIQSLLFLTIFLRISHCADPMINPINDPAMAAAFNSLSRGCRPPPIFAINRKNITNGNKANIVPNPVATTHLIDMSKTRRMTNHSRAPRIIPNDRILIYVAGVLPQ